MASPAAEPTTDPGRVPGPGQDPEQERTLGQLVASASKDLSTIVRGEIDLAKAELSTAMQSLGKGAGMLIGAALFGLYALGFLLTALGWGLYELGLTAWLAFLIVAVLLLVIAGVLALIGRRALTKARLKPEQAIESTQKTIAALKHEG